jgi:hypothetical protein
VSTLHVFISTGRFRSFEQMREFIDETYTDDGDGIPSAFMGEVELSDYEPGCIEAVHEERPLPLSTLLADASYADQWLPKIDGARSADSAICVLAPNQVGQPHRSSMEYVGAFDYEE